MSDRVDRNFETPTTGIKIVATRFASMGHWASSMNCHAGGAGNWYIVGGCAAWLNIEAYTNKAAADYAGMRMQIFPGDIEIDILDEVVAALKRRYGQMYVSVEGKVLKVDLFPVAKAEFENRKSRCRTYDLPNTNTSISIYSTRTLISRYQTASNPDKAEKRQLRVAIMTLMLRSAVVDSAAVEQTKKIPSFGMLLKGGVKLKPPDKKT